MVACTGAKTTDVNANQLSALSSSTGLVSITIGGNDVGFSNIMTTCVLESSSSCVAAVNAAEAKAQSSLPGLLNTTYNNIRSHAPNAQVVHGPLACEVSLNDLAMRPPQPIEPDGVLVTGSHRMRFLATPHVPHNWESGLWFDETTRTLFSGDLFTSIGNSPAEMAAATRKEAAMLAALAKAAGIEPE
jgi:hypothetical protein